MSYRPRYPTDMAERRPAHLPNAPPPHHQPARPLQLHSPPPKPSSSTSQRHRSSEYPQLTSRQRYDHGGARDRHVSVPAPRHPITLVEPQQPPQRQPVVPVVDLRRLNRELHQEAKALRAQLDVKQEQIVALEAGNKQLQGHRSQRRGDGGKKALLDDMEQEMMCPICTSVMVDPLLLNPCGHGGCGGCIVNWLITQVENAGKASCPICRTDIHICIPYIQNRHLENLIGRWVEEKMKTGNWEDYEDYLERSEDWKTFATASPEFLDGRWLRDAMQNGSPYRESNMHGESLFDDLFPLANDYPSSPIALLPAVAQVASRAHRHNPQQVSSHRENLDRRDAFTGDWISQAYGPVQGPREMFRAVFGDEQLPPIMRDMVEMMTSMNSFDMSGRDHRRR